MLNPHIGLGFGCSEERITYRARFLLFLHLDRININNQTKQIRSISHLMLHCSLQTLPHITLQTSWPSWLRRTTVSHLNGRHRKIESSTLSEVVWFFFDTSCFANVIFAYEAPYGPRFFRMRQN